MWLGAWGAPGRRDMARSVPETIGGGTLAAVLVARVRRTIEAHALLDRGARVLVAISGGADSLALLHALRSSGPELDLSLEAATVDHGLRPESGAEHERVEAYVRSLGIPCALLRLSLEPGASTQGRARDARYAALSAHATQRACSAIAVAHTLDDQAETVLERMLRGAGIRGLSGALRRREDRVIRPMLDVSRAEVRAYLHDLGLSPLVEDPSNADPRFLRVRVRSKLLPGLAHEQPEIASMLARLADDAREHREIVETLAERVGVEDGLERTRLVAEPPPVRRQVWRRWASHHGVPQLGRAHLEALDTLCLTGRGEARLPGARVVVIESGRLVVHALEGRADQGTPADPESDDR